MDAMSGSDGEIEVATAQRTPETPDLQGRAKELVLVVHDDFVEERGAAKNLAVQRAGEQRDVCVRIRPAQRPQQGNGAEHVAELIVLPDDEDVTHGIAWNGGHAPHMHE